LERPSIKDVMILETFFPANYMFPYKDT